ncbi:endonuclease/exonuclease/phosphatase family protein [Actinoplanes sp. Pm04-4]|uniref:Endonuclease/exonuclease/phosphatase family protein n=1 Tax=Paractinoplanes pyxinae TaxID=2997416 RepID=A0ABT4BC30_9ACTN|nr:endonuclease/exonuclease/phosphatase family protein [Actinoplanes pyxinae]MCY1144078.1 endonuclease/exonuclease/phosphatase family protein [Actinoplanes pyxinae]
MSFNIRHCEGPGGVLDVARIARVIRGSDAEIIGLQEVDRHFGDRSDWVDQVAELRRLVDFDACYGVNQDLGPPAPGRPRAQYGTAILSRHPIRRWRNTHLFKSPQGEQRGLLHAEIDVGGTPLHIFTVHLEWFAQTDRPQQVKEVVELIGSTSPAILLGDFNAPPTAPEIDMIRASFTDCWSLLRDGAAPTYPADAPTTCIDYIFAGQGVAPERVGVVMDDPMSSDHLPVLARLVLAAPPRSILTNSEWCDQ